MQPERRQDKGPRPKPRWMPLPQLLYAQVAKSYRRRRLAGVKYRVVFGTWQRVEQVLSACGWKINTAFVERLNLDLRQRVAAVGRRVNTLCQGEDGLQHQLVLFQSYHNFVIDKESWFQCPDSLPKEQGFYGCHASPSKEWGLLAFLVIRFAPGRELLEKSGQARADYGFAVQSM